MDPRNPVGLAQKALPVVAGIATRLGINTLNPAFAELGGWLCTLAEELSNLGYSPNQSSTLMENVEKILDSVERACGGYMYREGKYPALTEIAEAQSREFSGRSGLPTSSRRDREIGQHLTNYVLKNPEFKQLLRFIEGSSTLKNHGSADVISDEDAVLVQRAEEIPSYPPHVNNDFYNSLSLHMCCCACEQGRHQARLRLNTKEERQDTHAVRFEMLFSASSSDQRLSAVVDWQETKILVPRSKKPSGKRARFNVSPTQKACFSQERSESSKLIEPGQFCTVLRPRQNSLLSLRLQYPALKQCVDDEVPMPKVKSVDSRSLSDILRDGRMSKKAKCILAYTLAKSFWQYYGSDWMKTPWTPEIIHLLDDQPPQTQHLEDQNYSCRPYLVAQFGEDITAVPDYCAEDSVMHRYPKVLALGILLIEVAKGQVLQMNDVPRLCDERSINKRFESAWSSLSKGVLGEIDDYSTYRKAVEKCLDFDLFTETEDSPKERKLKERRDILYTKIVSPLRRLLEGTGWISETDVIKQGPAFQSTELHDPITSGPHFSCPQVLRERIEDLSERMELRTLPTKPELLAGNSIWTPDFWLKKVDALNRTITLNQNYAKPIKIAVLDTGCDLNAPIFQIPAQAARIKNRWKDLVEDSPLPKDDNGHGTRVVSLLLRVATSAEVYVARVARDQKSLRTADVAIASAIKHAATTWQVDLISMSFGFPREMERVTTAIREAEFATKNSIIFFAAASNDGSNTTEMFPAFMDSIISVRGTDTAGAFIPLYDPEAPHSDRGRYFGILGQNVPCGWPDDSPSMLMSGCSIATPIAVGTAALIMQCVAAWPEKFKTSDQAMIRSRSGISESLLVISVRRGNDRFYIVPWKLLDNDGRLRLREIGAALDRLRP